MRVSDSVFELSDEYYPYFSYCGRFQEGTCTVCSALNCTAIIIVCFDLTIEGSRSGHVLYCYYYCFDWTIEGSRRGLVLNCYYYGLFWFENKGSRRGHVLYCTATIIVCFGLTMEGSRRGHELYCTATIIVCFGLTMEGSRRVAAALLT